MKKIRNMFLRNLVFVFLPLVITSCGRAYDGLQAYSVVSCYELPYSEQQGCLEQVQSTYEEYSQDRKAALPDAEQPDSTTRDGHQTFDFH